MHDDAYCQRKRDIQKTWWDKKRQEDPEYHQDHLAKMKAYYDTNRNNFDSKLEQIKRGAASREYVWDALMTDEVCAAMMTSECFYCGILPTTSLNGIDRMDNSHGYFTENCVGCCGTCNNTKMCLDARTYVNRCIHTGVRFGATVVGGAISFPDAWPDCLPSSFSRYKSNAKKKNRVFEITKEQYSLMTNTPCYYCERTITETNKSGMDRVDNDEGYTTDNIISCCGECNRMRGNTGQDEYIDMVKRIASRAHLIHIPSMPVCLRVITRRKVSVSSNV